MARSKHGKPPHGKNGGRGGRKNPHRRNFSDASSWSNPTTAVGFSLRDTAVNTGRRDNLVQSSERLWRRPVVFVSPIENALPPPLIEIEDTSRTEACPPKSDNAPSEDVPSAALASMNLLAELMGTTDLTNTKEMPTPVIQSGIGESSGLDRYTAQPGFMSGEVGSGAKPGLGSSIPGLRCSSPTPSNSSEEVIVFTGRNPAKASNTEQTPHNSAAPRQPLAMLEADHAGDRSGAAAGGLLAQNSPPQVTLPEWNDVGRDWVHRDEKASRRSKKARKRQNRDLLGLDPDSMDDYISNLVENNNDDVLRQRVFTGTRPLSLDDGLDNFVLDASHPPLLEWDPKTEDGRDEGAEDAEDNEDEVDEEDDSESEDDDDDDDDMGRLSDEEDLIERRKARMTDEQIARILSKQEELGMGSADIVLFDDLDDDDGDEFEKYVYGSGYGPGHGVHARAEGNARDKKSGKKGPSVEQQQYGDFDLMDFEPPSVPRSSRRRGLDEAASWLDPDLRETMLNAWGADREKKRLKKAERQRLRKLGLLGRKKGKVNLAAKYPQGISKQQIMNEIRDFLSSPHQSLPFPPMDKDERRQLHQAATAFKLKSKSVGSGASRFPVLIRTSRTVAIDDDTAFAHADNRYDQPLRRGVKKDRSRKPNAMSKATYMDGDIVGSSAPELGADNKGRAMMEKMGWTHGMALGLKNEGILHPIEHRVKNSKAGLA
ncbi:MAG: hypothetical protein Q9157_003713 [Trypethelium eluteriae]